MERGNVLVIGNSGVGKSTLINSVLGEGHAKTGFGTSGTTNKLEIYESDEIAFRIIDSVGFEPSMIKGRKAINEVKKWSKNSAKEGNEDNKINVIWFCVEGTSSKLFPDSIKHLSRATAMWKSVPIIVVITKSFSVSDRSENIKMVNKAFEEQKRHFRKPNAIIPVVASTFTLNETAFAPPEGITELIDSTNTLMPEGIKAGDKDVYTFKLKRKKSLAQSIVGMSTAAAITVGAIPIPFSDAAILAPIEIAEVQGLARLYEIENNEESKRFLNSIVEVGTVSLVAKSTINTLKVIPGINLAASVINAIVAGAIVAAIGQGSIYAFEKIYTGEKSLEDIDWIKKVIEAQITNQFIDRVMTAVKQIQKSGDTKDISKKIIPLIMDLFFKEGLTTK